MDGNVSMRPNAAQANRSNSGNSADSAAHEPGISPALDDAEQNLEYSPGELQKQREKNR